MENKVNIASSAIVCEEAELLGDITIGEHTIIHPKCKIVATAGPIVIGEANVIEEGTYIENISDVDQDDSCSIMTIGNNNLLRVNATIYSKFIGNLNEFQVQSTAAVNSVIHNECCIGSKVKVHPGQIVPDQTILVQVNDRLVKRENQPFHVQQHVELLRHYQQVFGQKDSKWYMGNFHHLI